MMGLSLIVVLQKQQSFLTDSVDTNSVLCVGKGVSKKAEIWILGVVLSPTLIFLVLLLAKLLGTLKEVGWILWQSNSLRLIIRLFAFSQS